MCAKKVHSKKKINVLIWYNIIYLYEDLLFNSFWFWNIQIIIVFPWYSSSGEIILRKKKRVLTDSQKNTFKTRNKGLPPQKNEYQVV